MLRWLLKFFKRLAKHHNQLEDILTSYKGYVGNSPNCANWLACLTCLCLHKQKIEFCFSKGGYLDTFFQDFRKIRVNFAAFIFCI